MRTPSIRPPVISITNGTFYRHHPNSTTGRPNPPLFSNLNFTQPSAVDPPTHWLVTGPSLSGKSTLLQLLRGQHLCFPPTARNFPYLATDAVPLALRTPDRAIQYVGFSNDSLSTSAAKATHLSARYESKREKTDFSLRDFLLGNTELNALEPAEETTEPALLDKIVHDLNLSQLLELPVAFLSNGQGRRARIARALLRAPEVLLLDEPFMGLDPPTVASLSPLLHSLASRANPRLILTARPQDPIPDWITHLVYLHGNCQVGAIGEKSAVLQDLRSYVQGVWSGVAREDRDMAIHNIVQMGTTLTAGGIQGQTIMGSEPTSADEAGLADISDSSRSSLGEPLVEMNGCVVQYQGNIALGNWSQQVDGRAQQGLIWTVRRGERWGIFGPNGSGKTTILSLICSDHPQTYSLPIRLFGRSRLPEPGSDQLPLTIWDIQARIGHSSPEIHQLMPRSVTVRQVLESAWADTFRSKPTLSSESRDRVDSALRWFEADLNPAFSAPDEGSGLDLKITTGLDWSSHYMFGELSFSAQRVALFLRAIIKNPDIVVLDEACSGMDDGVRDRCLLFLEHGQTKRYVTNEDGLVAIVANEAAQSSTVQFRGLNEDQALICISHVREEIPESIREWICLPEANSGESARLGKSRGPLGKDENSWRAIWDMGKP